MAPRVFTSRSILVVDDDRIMRELLLLMLGAEGHAVTSAGSGEEALALLAERSQDFDIVLTDMHMPGLQGMALAGRLRAAIDAACVLIGMSGSQPAPDEVAAFQAFLQKPFSVEQLHAVADRGRHVPSRKEQPASPHIPVLDETIFTRLCEMMPVEQLRELYRMTLEDVKRRLALMRSAAERDEDAPYRAEAHSIKGGCGMVGAAELSALAASIEKQAEPPAAIFDEFDMACERLRSMLESRIK